MFGREGIGSTSVEGMGFTSIRHQGIRKTILSNPILPEGCLQRERLAIECWPRPIQTPSFAIELFTSCPSADDFEILGDKTLEIM